MLVRRSKNYEGTLNQSNSILGFVGFNQEKCKMPCDTLHLADKVATFRIQELEAVDGGDLLISEVELLSLLRVGGLHQHDNKTQIQVGMLQDINEIDRLEKCLSLQK